MLVLSLLFTFEDAEGQLARDRTSIQTQVPAELPKQHQYLAFPSFCNPCQLLGAMKNIPPQVSTDENVRDGDCCVEIRCNVHSAFVSTKSLQFLLPTIQGWHGNELSYYKAP